MFIVSVVWTMSMKKLETKQLSVRLTKSKLPLTLAGCQVCLSFYFKIYIAVNCYLNFYVISLPVNNCLWCRIGCFVTIYFSSIKGLWSTLCYIRKEGVSLCESHLKMCNTAFILQWHLSNKERRNQTFSVFLCFE